MDIDCLCFFIDGEGYPIFNFVQPGVIARYTFKVPAKCFAYMVRIAKDRARYEKGAKGSDTDKGQVITGTPLFDQQQR